MNRRKIWFITGTRADFGKMKSLIRETSSSPEFEVKIIATGMHMIDSFGRTITEIAKAFPEIPIESFRNDYSGDHMDKALTSTIDSLSDLIEKEEPDMIVVHGDRLEALAGVITGVTKDVLVGHIEGGEVSGTIDESFRHAISKLAHKHLVSNETSRQRLMQMGESEESIHVIGSPDLDLMSDAKNLELSKILSHYEIPFEKYAVVIAHPVVTDVSETIWLSEFLENLVSAEDQNFIWIHPNNDPGSEFIRDSLSRLRRMTNIRSFPSIRFEYFVKLLESSQYLIGNSSSGVREAPFHGLPSVNMGTRQHRRANSESILDLDVETSFDIGKDLIQSHSSKKFEQSREFGDGGAGERFKQTISNPAFWITKKQKYFIDRFGS